MKTINLEDVLIFHRKLIARTGGVQGVRDTGLVESALNKPLMTFDGQELYQDIYGKIAAVTYALVMNHGFVDGNKRIGIAMMLLLLRLNQIPISYSQSELVNLGLGIANGTCQETDIVAWIVNHKNA